MLVLVIYYKDKASKLCVCHSRAITESRSVWLALLQKLIAVQYVPTLWKNTSMFIHASAIFLLGYSGWKQLVLGLREWHRKVGSLGRQHLLWGANVRSPFPGSAPNQREALVSAFS